MIQQSLLAPLVRLWLVTPGVQRPGCVGYYIDAYSEQDAAEQCAARWGACCGVEPQENE